MINFKTMRWVLMLFVLTTLFWRVSATIASAQQEVRPAGPQNGYLHSILSARATPTSYRPVTPTPLPAAYQVEQKHPAMITGAAVLVLIILAGVLAFSRHKA